MEFWRDVRKFAKIPHANRNDVEGVEKEENPWKGLKFKQMFREQIPNSCVEKEENPWKGLKFKHNDIIKFINHLSWLKKKKTPGRD